MTMNSEMQKNKDAYRKMKDRMEIDHPGKVVLLHNGELVDVFEDKTDAYKIGCERFGLGHFFLQTVGDRPISLGFMALNIPRAA